MNGVIKVIMTTIISLFLYFVLLVALYSLTRNVIKAAAKSWFEEKAKYIEKIHSLQERRND